MLSLNGLVGISIHFKHLKKRHSQKKKKKEDYDGLSNPTLSHQGIWR